MQKNGAFNVRIEMIDGVPHLGFVHKLYKTKHGGFEWKPAPDSIRNRLAKRLNIRVSSRCGGK